ncbi:hypothetical protein SDC9_74384 [bioreactor metagenome]|uniref:Uncharacterized protein n=1 Tax=bioreactor metagenome TaxID=1076179 RepID=A0A644YHR6_9ZZZZ
MSNAAAIARDWLVGEARRILDWIRHQGAHDVIDQGLHKHQRGSVVHRNAGQSAGQIIGQIGGLQVVSLDIAKNVFQIHTADMRSGEIINAQLKRAKVLEHFARRAPCLIDIEACGVERITGQGN